ncbi:MAG: deoxyribodipyrimidine photo-lyase/cryptochrome family protein [Devosiaceae bacterium]|nr:deoxyribodipyrimidine photo-lyase/cryptochrome family protein [Devosiaceae bacterium MH13]
MIQVVWFKRDLRVDDHRPLFEAAAAGPVLPLLIIEPGYWACPDTAARHYAFWQESARDLIETGLPLVVKTGAATDLLSQLHREHTIAGLWSHEETGNDWTYARDRAVSRWCKQEGIPWVQHRQFGVVRGPVNRDRWAQQWERFMAEPPVPRPEGLGCVPERSDPWPSLSSLGLEDEPCPGRQTGGRKAGLALFESFLGSGRGRGYRKAMSSPEAGADACSRLSSYLAYGCLSMRETVQAAYKAKRDLAAIPPAARSIGIDDVNSFIARLHWHCHFIQKLETEPQIENRDLHPAFRGIRSHGTDHPHYQAFATGNTGFPFIDACMRSLIATGWINFRMRAMLTAFASYHLWLDWRASGNRLAQLFTDYEPGIHWSQTQMQSGSTAINTPRIYNPVKQSRDQDPDGRFILKWVPETSVLPFDAVHEPWTVSAVEARACGYVPGETYPERIIDHEKAARAARERLTQIRRTDGFREHQRAIFLKHGSRKRSRHTPAQQRAWKRKGPADDQLELDV